MEAVAAYYGVLAAGAIAVVLNENLRPRQVETACADAGARLILATTALLQRQPRALRCTAQSLELEEVTTRADWQVVECAASDPAQIVYTSGSTGLPKGVLLSHGNLAADVAIVAGYLGLTSADRTISLLPFSSVYGLNQLLCSIAVGGTLVIERSPLPNAIAAALRTHSISVLAAVPPLWLQLLQAPEFTKARHNSLRVLQSAGGYLPVSAVRAIRAAQPHAQLFIMYGLTEVMRSTYLSPDQVDKRPDSMGRAMPESAVQVLRADGTECDAGEAGELVHSGPTSALGYWNQPEATAEVFQPGTVLPGYTAVRSGDVVRRDEDGFLYFVARRDRLIKTLGYRVGPDEIIDALLASAQLLDVAITTEPDAARGEAIIAHVVLREGVQLESIRQFSRLELPRWLQPVRFQVYEQLPTLPNGKHDLARLKSPSTNTPNP